MLIAETDDPEIGGGPDADEPLDPGVKKEPEQILRVEIREGLKALERKTIPLFLSALSAGLDIGFSLYVIAVIVTRARDAVSPLLLEFLVANAYSIGFIFVVLGRSELFTEQTTLAVLPVLSRRSSLRRLLRLWVVVYVANLIGAACFAFLAVTVGVNTDTIQPWAFGEVARKILAHSDLGIFLGAMLAGWLMGLLSWLVAAGRETISAIVIVWLITMVIGFANLQHVIVGTVEVLAGAFAGQGITLSDFVRFLGLGTLGNIVGGSLFVAVIKYGHARVETEEHDFII